MTHKTYKDLESNNLMEIDSVSSFISKIRELRESTEGASTELYFRGQEVEFWDIEPSVFRNRMLSIEHKLMQIPLQKIPTEFKELNTKFDIMTKYQHYGMCTRLLDLTTNPLVALYFACKYHGEEFYISDDGKESHEPYGVIYFVRDYYPLSPTDLEVQIIAALANYDLSKENTVGEILLRLKREGIIDKETKDRWMEKDGFLEFVEIIQRNYMVIPTYTNERLRKQSGVFLLTSLFTVSSGADIATSVISKSRGNLREAFETDYFFVRGENKEEILKELDLYNINEATLFPELEHQLSYIKHINNENVQAVSDFEKYESFIKEDRIIQIFDNDGLDNYIINNLPTILNNIALSDDVDQLSEIIRNNLAVDWYKRETIISKMRRAISGYYSQKGKTPKEAAIISKRIIELLKQNVKDYIELYVESGE